MIPYYMLIGIPLLFEGLYILGRKNKALYEDRKNYSLIVFFLIYFLLLAFRRDDIGADTQRYIQVFEDISTRSWKTVLLNVQGQEIGYSILNKIISEFTYEYRILLILVAFITVVPIAAMYYKESENALITMALFLVMPVFQMNFSGLRQAIAMTMVVPAFYATREKKTLTFLLSVVVAMLFHKTAFVISLIYPIYHIRLRKEHLLIIVPIAILFFRYNETIFKALIPLFGEEFEGRTDLVIETGAYSMLILYIMFAIYAFIVPNRNEMSKDVVGLRNLLLLAVFLQMFVPLNRLVMRINYYLILFIPITITKITNRWTSIDKRHIYMLNIILFMFFMVYYLYKINAVDSLHIYPYKAFWSN